MATNKRNGIRNAEPKRDELVNSACQLIDRIGVERFSMRVLGAEMGLSATASYRHVANKDELLLLAADTILAHVVLPDPDQAWNRRFAQLGESLCGVIEEHRWVPGVLANRTHPVPNLERILEELRNILLAGGMSPKEVPRAMNLFWAFTNGVFASAGDPRPDLRFGVEVILAGLEARTKSSPPKSGGKH